MNSNRYLFSQPLALHHTLLRLAFWTSVLVLLFMAVGRPMPGGPSGVMSLYDKVFHAVVYGALTLMAIAGRYQPFFVLSVLLVHGALIEVLQSLVPSRTADWNDFLADCIGVFVALTAACMVKSRLQ